MFTPGSVISELISKKGKRIVFRFPTVDDVENCRQYINELSREDTFITFSGEQLSFDEEKKYVEEWIEKMRKGDMVVVLGFHNEKLVCNASVTRQTRRSQHVGVVGISTHVGCREEGIGSEVMKLLEHFGRKMNLRLLELSVFANNQRARYLYQKHGYKEVGVIPEKLLYRGSYIDEVIMVKQL